MAKTALTAFARDSEAPLVGVVITAGLAAVPTFEDPLHKIIIFAICAVLAGSYKWARTLKKTSMERSQAITAEALVEASENLKSRRSQ